MTMITIYAENFNLISQTSYDSLIQELDLASLPCPCGHCGSLIWYGSYKRSLTLTTKKITIFISRVFCKECGHTHAILPTDIVPYSQIPLPSQVEIVRCFEHRTGYRPFLHRQLFLDEQTISYVLRNYRRYWRERLLSLKLTLSPLRDLIRGCFSFFSRQFLQIKCTRNQLFILPT